MKLAIGPLQQAVLDRLASDAALSALTVQVYEEQQATPSYPHIVLGECMAVPWQTKLEQGEDTLCTLHCRSQSTGKQEVSELLSLTLDALTRTPLPLEAGYEWVATNWVSAQIIDSEDETADKHGVLKVKMMIINEQESE